MSILWTEYKTDVFVFLTGDIEIYQVLLKVLPMDGVVVDKSFRLHGPVI